MEKFNKVLAGNRIKSRRLELELTLSAKSRTLNERSVVAVEFVG